MDTAGRGSSWLECTLPMAADFWEVKQAICQIGELYIDTKKWKEIESISTGEGLYLDEGLRAMDIIYLIYGEVKAKNKTY